MQVCLTGREREKEREREKGEVYFEEKLRQAVHADAWREGHGTPADQGETGDRS